MFGTMANISLDSLGFVWASYRSRKLLKFMDLPILGSGRSATELLPPYGEVSRN